MRGKLLRKFLCLSLFALTVISISSCNKSDDVIFSPKLNENEEVNLNVIGLFSNFEAFDQVTNDFNKYYPNVKFSYQQVAGGKVKEYLDKNNNSVDIFMTSKENYVDGSDDLINYCLDLSSADVDINLEDLDHDMLKPNYKNNILHSIPMGQNIYGIIVNKTLLKKFNIDVPTNYNEFINALEILKTNGYTPIQGPDSKVMAELTINMMADCKINNQLDYNKALEIFNIIDTMINNGYTDLNINASYPYDNYDQAILKFFEGDVAFWVCNSEKVSGMKKRESKSSSFKANPFEYTYIYSPIGNNGAYVYSEPWYGFSINKNSKNIEFAKEFMRFLVTKDEINKMADIKGIPSIAKNKNNSSIYNDIINPQKIEEKCVDNGVITSLVNTNWYSCVNNYYNKKITRDEAINYFLS